jgi:hypothetical protein
MHSRLYEQLLNNHPRLQHTAAFNSLYDNSGIVGVFTTTDADYAEEAINLVAKELQARASQCTLPPTLLSGSGHNPVDCSTHQYRGHHRSCEVLCQHEARLRCA